MRRIEVNGTVIVLDGFAEVLPFAGLPPVGVKQIGLPHRVLLGEASVI
jgi:hypothetical protein